jgi:hypothetical protein
MPEDTSPEGGPIYSHPAVRDEASATWDGKTFASAVISADGLYRYHLWRKWDGDDFLPGTFGEVCFIMLNPSTADGTQDDPTIRCCIRYAQGWGFTSLAVRNLFAYRAVDPAYLVRAQANGVDIEGPGNLATLHRCTDCDLVIAAWGAHPLARSAAYECVQFLARLGIPLYCLGANADGSPVHPLHQPAGAQPLPYCPEDGPHWRLLAEERKARRCHG